MFLPRTLQSELERALSPLQLLLQHTCRPDLLLGFAGCASDELRRSVKALARALVAKARWRRLRQLAETFRWCHAKHAFVMAIKMALVRKAEQSCGV